MEPVVNDYIIEVPELTNHFDYDGIIDAVKDCMNSVPSLPPSQQNTAPLDNYWDEWEVEISNPFWKKHADGQTVLNVSPKNFQYLKESSLRLFESLMDCINTDDFYMPLDAWICHKPIDSWVRPHVDGHRVAALMFPIEPLEYTTSYCSTGLEGKMSWKKANQSETRQASQSIIEDEWHNQTWGDVIYEHKYKAKVPTIMNSKKFHSVLDYKQTSRIVFQISWYYKSKHLTNPQEDEWDGWPELVDYYKSGKLFKF